VYSICIDQATVRERYHQVQLMKQIYSQAERVYVWLGGDPTQIAGGGLGALQRLVRDRSEWFRGYNQDTLGLDQIFATCGFVEDGHFKSLF
jgi:TRAP-type mannitol/chloroaromatic compound transport system substrate-binding protein